MVPVGVGESISEYVAKCIEILEDSGLEYELTPMGTIVEGEGNQVIPTIMECHEKVMEMSNRVITSVKIDDRRGRKGAMKSKVKSVRNKLS